MTLGDLIKEKDYEKIEFRMICEARKDDSIFYGVAKSIEGKLIALDEDDYEEELKMEIVSYEEWSNPEKNIENGLTVVFDFSRKGKI